MVARISSYAPLAATMASDRTNSFTSLACQRPYLAGLQIVSGCRNADGLSCITQTCSDTGNRNHQRLFKFLLLALVLQA